MARPISGAVSCVRLSNGRKMHRALATRAERGKRTLLSCGFDEKQSKSEDVFSV